MRNRLQEFCPFQTQLLLVCVARVCVCVCEGIKERIPSTKGVFRRVFISRKKNGMIRSPRAAFLRVKSDDVSAVDRVNENQLKKKFPPR